MPAPGRYLCARAALVLAAACVLLHLPVPAAGSIEEAPLAPRSGPRGATLFVEMPPERTGIVTRNDYADPRMWGELYQELTFGAIGTGVAIGDYDGDGRPDIFIAAKSDPCRLFRNLGDWRFEDVTEASGLATIDAAANQPQRAWTQGVAFVDVNNDGRLDLYVCRFGAPNWLLINQGDGTFREEAAARGLDMADASAMAAFADFDRDGWLDVYVQTNMLSAPQSPAGQPDRLYRNNGDGTFTDVTAAAGISGDTCGHSVLWWDFDHDGWPDLHVANDYAVPNRLYRNNGDGTFTDVIDAVMPAMPYYAMGADLGDVNNDGRLDLLVADMLPTTHETDQRGMAASRSMNRENRDGAPQAPQYMRNLLLLDSGTPWFLEAAQMAGLHATDWTWSVRFEDLDEDGRVDLHITNGMLREYHNVDILQRILASESLQAQRTVIRESPVLAEANLAFRNLGDLRFEDVSAAWGLAQRGVSFGAAFGDLDGDGDLDLVFGNHQAGATVLRNDNDSGHRVVIALRGTQGNRFGVGATVRLETAAGVQVRHVMTARGALSTSEPIVHFGLGPAARIHRLTVTWPGGHVQSFADLAADRRYTITEPSGAPPAPAPEPAAPPALFDAVTLDPAGDVVAEELFSDEPGAQPFLPWTLNRRGPALAVADLDGDGRDDLVLGGTPRAPARVLLRRPGGAAVQRALQESPSPVDDGPILVFDADGDGHRDILLTRTGTRRPAASSEYQPRLLLGDGAGGFRAAPEGALPRLIISVGAAAAADFDRDGRPDLFIGGRVVPGRYPLPARSALLANRGGRFEDVTDTLAPGLREAGLATSAIWTDLDGDGWIDLVVAYEWGGIAYWRNNDGRGFEDRSAQAGLAAAGTGLWTALAVADFNGDGRPDIVAGNLGLNTRYEAGPERPALAFLGAFSTGSVPQLIEARHDGGRLVPWRTRRELSSRIPAIQRRYPLNDDFARASLGEILGEDRIAAARRFAVTELRSGVFLSQAGGTWRFEPLPRVAQIAPAQGVVAADLDGDGHADIHLLHNLHAPDATLGRFTGGLGQLLLGDGRGGLEVVAPARSGLAVRGDGKALVLLDLEGDGRPGLVATQNGGPALAFRASGAPEGRAWLRVSPEGAGAIGARVEVEFAGGGRQARETGAGGGHFSQSSLACFFGYAVEAPPRLVRVRWADGAKTEHAVPAGAATLRVER